MCNLTKEEREDREILEAAEDLMLKVTGSSSKAGETPHGYTVEIIYPGGWIDLVEKTGYRKK